MFPDMWIESRKVRGILLPETRATRPAQKDSNGNLLHPELYNEIVALQQDKHRYPLPPDVMQKIQAAQAGLDRTEKFAQQQEKIINGELKASQVKKLISRDMTTKTLTLGIAVLASVGLVPARAQNVPPLVVIQVRGGSLRANTPFVAHLKNDLAVPITFCADFGKTVQTKSGQQAAPNPFEIQKWNGKRWDTQLIGTDVGSGNTAASIDAHESKDFSLQINDSGRYRLRLTYLEGESDSKCPLPPEHANRISSKPFSMKALLQK